jgi:hypothetical protein
MTRSWWEATTAMCESFEAKIVKYRALNQALKSSFKGGDAQ